MGSCHLLSSKVPWLTYMKRKSKSAGKPYNSICSLSKETQLVSISAQFGKVKSNAGNMRECTRKLNLFDFSARLGKLWRNHSMADFQNLLHRTSIDVADLLLQSFKCASLAGILCKYTDPAVDTKPMQSEQFSAVQLLCKHFVQKQCRILEQAGLAG